MHRFALNQTSSIEGYPSTAFVLAIVAGALIIAGGIVAITGAYFGSPFGMAGPPRNFRGPPIPHRNVSDVMIPPRNISDQAIPTRSFGHMSFRPFIFGGLAIASLVSGVIVLISALMLRRKPKENTTWGILILVFSIVSFFGLGGFLIGAILGIVSGALILGWNPKMASGS